MHAASIPLDHAIPQYNRSGLSLRLSLILALLLAAPLHAQEREGALYDRFFQSQGAHFTILFEGPQDYGLAGRALEVLEQAYFRIGTALYTFPDHPITVILYTQQQFRDITRAPAWAAGAYDGRIRIPIRGALSQPDELERVLSHELAHAMIQTIAPRGVPTWLNEGLAVTFEPHGSAWADAELAAASARLPFARLAGSFGTLSGNAARLAYAQSAVMARRLFDDGGGAAVVAVLQDLAQGTTFRAAYEQRLFLPYESLVGAEDGGR
jgi:hypothetical protein